jgi:hypothetical protein
MRYQLRQGPVATKKAAGLSGLQNRVGGLLPQSLLVLAGIHTLLGNDCCCNRGTQEENLLHRLTLSLVRGPKRT